MNMQQLLRRGAAAMFALLCLLAPLASAQTKPDLAGDWQGTLQAQKALRTIVRVTRTDKGYSARWYSIDQNPEPVHVASATLNGSGVSLVVDMIGGTYAGTLSPDGNTITGTWTQMPNKPLPLTFPAQRRRRRRGRFPRSPAPPKRMTAADPSFDVATIKPSEPGFTGKGFGINGRKFSTKGTTLDDLIEFACDVHEKQIVGGPDWMDKDKFDVDAVTSDEGVPDFEQTKSMVRKLIADRFKLTFHHEKKVLSVYVLSVEPGGPKNVTKSESTMPGFQLPIRPTPGGIMIVMHNGTMTNFAVFGLQGAVLDRPVLDQTGLPDRLDFTLKWLPDDSQFGGHMKIPPGEDAGLPGLFTAIHEQLGLKLEPTKAPADVMVIDRVEMPTSN